MSDSCYVCNFPLNRQITEATRGMGDGRGDKFAHESCYWRTLYQRLREKPINFEDFPDMRTPSTLLQYLEAALQDAHARSGHILDYADCKTEPCTTGKAGCAQVRSALFTAAKERTTR